MNLKELILNPNDFFKNLANKEVSLKTPFLIVLTFSVFMSIYTYYTTSIMFKIFPPDMQGMMSMMMIITAVSSLVGGVIAWLLIAGVMHLISMALRGKVLLKEHLNLLAMGFYQT